MRTFCIHIGTPKTGSTAIQRYSRDNYDYLKSKGLDFLIRRRRGAYNDLAIYLRGNHLEDAAKIGADIRSRIAASDAQTFCLSSEMFASYRAQELKDALALDEAFNIKIIGYFRRQDRYLESSYKQKMKTGKIAPGFDNHLAKFGLDAGQYVRIMEAWETAWPEAEFVFRRFETARFPQGDVIRDFLSMFDIDIDADGVLPSDEVANPSPSIDVLDLMHVASSVRGIVPRSVFRSLPTNDLPRFRGRAMPIAQAKDILAEFADVNEELRQRFFPEDKVLFDASDLDEPEEEVATSSFTEEQRYLIRELLRAVVYTVNRNK